MKKNIRIILLITTICLSGCLSQRKVITTGSYGPFNIGSSKTEVLDIIENITNITAITPKPSETVYIKNPSLEKLTKLNTSNGILVWLDHYPWPLRVELDQNQVINKWGVNEKCIASKEGMNLACMELNRLNKSLDNAQNRNDVYQQICNFKTKLSKTVGNFVVGYHKYRLSENINKKEYRELLLSNDAWEFNGLKQLSKYFDPFYSRITIYYIKGKLSKIEHWSLPNELP